MIVVRQGRVFVLFDAFSQSLAGGCRLRAIFRRTAFGILQCFVRREKLLLSHPPSHGSLTS